MKITVATARLRSLDEVDDIGEEDWRVVLAFADGTTESDVRTAILAKLQAEMAEWGPPDHQDLTAADMDHEDGARICWQSQTVEVATPDPTVWAVGEVIDWPAGDFRSLLVMFTHGSRAVLFDALGGAESFIPAQTEGDDWVIISDDENGVATYGAALALIMAEA